MDLEGSITRKPLQSAIPLWLLRLVLLVLDVHTLSKLDITGVSFAMPVVVFFGVALLIFCDVGRGFSEGSIVNVPESVNQRFGQCCASK